MATVKKIAMWAGIIFTGLCGIVLLGGGKIMSGTMLVTLTFVMLLPVWRRSVPLWARAGLVCVLFGVVVWNISTTDLPGSSNTMKMACVGDERASAPSTGVKLLDQVTYIFNSFTSQAESS